MLIGGRMVVMDHLFKVVMNDPEVIKLISDYKDIHGYTITFFDERKNRIIYQVEIDRHESKWASIFKKEWFDLRIEIKRGVHVLWSYKPSYDGEKAVLNLSFLEPTEENAKIVENFIDALRIDPIVIGENWQRYDYIIGGNDDAKNVKFYFTLDEILSFFKHVEKQPDSVVVKAKSRSLGDSIALTRYVSEFAKKRGIPKLRLVTGFKELFEGVYDNIEIIRDEDFKIEDCSEVIVSEYLFDRPLQKGFSDNLGLEWKRLRPAIKRVNGERPIKNKYVCFTVHTTSQCKYWNYPGGWDTLCKMLRKKGLTPVCIDRYETFGIEGHWNSVPTSGAAVKRIGISLDEIINYLEHCEFFIGVSSGVSWMAHALGKKVVMISGVTLPDNEFTEDVVRIHESSVCNSCFNFPKENNFDAMNWLWCPRQTEEEKKFICSKSITPERVMFEIESAGLLDI